MSTTARNGLLALLKKRLFLSIAMAITFLLVLGALSHPRTRDKAHQYFDHALGDGPAKEQSKPVLDEPKIDLEPSKHVQDEKIPVLDETALPLPAPAPRPVPHFPAPPPPSPPPTPLAPTGPPPVKYRPEPTYTPPPVPDPWPHLTQTITPPPIPAWNHPHPDLHTIYNLTTAPALLISFTRSYPLLLQSLASYIAAGWPASSIHVVENTGTFTSNNHNLLSLQNPFHLNHTQLRALGVNVIQTPVRLSFAQVQNFFLYIAREQGWDWFFWSHQDVLAFGFEEGKEGTTPAATESGYKSLYELSLAALAEVKGRSEDMAKAGNEKKKGVGYALFEYDHLTLVNRQAYEEVGGWDVNIPYYLTDCDFYHRLGLEGWERNETIGVGEIFDVSTVLKDFGALFRLEAERWEDALEWVDLNPPPPAPPSTPESQKDGANAADFKAWKSPPGRRRRRETDDFPTEEFNQRQTPGSIDVDSWGQQPPAFGAPHQNDGLGLKAAPVPAFQGAPEPVLNIAQAPPPTSPPSPSRIPNPPLATTQDLTPYRHLLTAAKSMAHYKTFNDRGRNTWQIAQHGGEGEPFYYHWRGLQESMEVLTEAGKEVFARKWGHKECGLGDTRVRTGDVWRVEGDW